MLYCNIFMTVSKEKIETLTIKKKMYLLRINVYYVFDIIKLNAMKILCQKLSSSNQTVSPPP